jgi:predicted transcriptional regulator
MMRVLSAGSKNKEVLVKEIEKSKGSKNSGFVSKQVVKNIENMRKNGLVIKKGNSVMLTPLGKRVFEATRDILFMGKSPKMISVEEWKEMRKGRMYRRGPLTTTFSGGTSRKSFRLLLDLADEHANKRTNWLPYIGRKKKSGSGYSIASITNLVRQGFLEFEVPVSIKPGNIGGHLAKFPKDHGLSVFELSGPAHHGFQLLNEKDLARYHRTSTGLISKRKLEHFRNYLIRKGISSEVANKLRSPMDAEILWLLSRGVTNYPEINRRTGYNLASINMSITRLSKNGIIKGRRTLFRVTEKVPAAMVQEGVKERFTTDQVIKYLRKLEAILKK